MLQYVPDQYITQEICNKLVDCNPWQLKCVPNQCITQEMYTRTLERCPWSLECIPNWYVTEQQIRTWCGDDDHGNYDGLIKWHMDIKNGRLKKAKKKEELLPLLGIYQEGGIGVFLRTKTRNRKIVVINLFPCLMTNNS